jgi:hypothetical protein
VSLKSAQESIVSDPISSVFGYALQNPIGVYDASGEGPIRVVILIGAGAMKVCMRIARCRDAVKRAKEFCDDVECKFARERADHKFKDRSEKPYCEHYRLTCWSKKAHKEIFSEQWVLPGRCFDKKQSEFEHPGGG